MELHLQDLKLRVMLLALLAAALVPIVKVEAIAGFRRGCDMSEINCDRPQYTIETTLKDSSKICCLTCKAPKTPPRTCSSLCQQANFTVMPCDSSCGDRSCKRGLCGQPLNGGANCCPELKCSDMRKVYLGSDCCPKCHDGSGDKPASPAQCKFNETNGIGDVSCQAASKVCAVRPVPKGRDSKMFDLSKLGLVCSKNEIAALKPLIDNFVAKMSAGSRRKRSLPGNPLQQIKTLLTQNTATISMLNRTQSVLSQIKTQSCRMPFECYAKAHANLSTKIEGLLSRLKQFGLQSTLKPSDLTEVEQLLASVPKSISSLTQGATLRAGRCMALLKTEKECVNKIRRINVFEVVRKSRCNITEQSDRTRIEMLAMQLNDSINENKVPNISLFRNLTCDLLQGPCTISIVSSFIRRVAGVCRNKAIEEMTMQGLRMSLLRCKNNDKTRFSDDEMISALASCMLTPADLKDIAARKLAALAANGISTTMNGMNMSLSAMIQQQMAANCPELKEAMDARVALNVSANIDAIDKEKLMNMMGSLQVPTLNSVKKAVFDGLDAADIERINAALQNDTSQAGKCVVLLKKISSDLAKLKKLRACANEMSGNQLKSAFSSAEDKKAIFSSMNTTNMKPRDRAKKMSGLREMMSGIDLTDTNCMDYMSTLCCVPPGQIKDSLCRSDTCFKALASALPNNPNTKFCQAKRPRPTKTDLGSMDKSVLKQLSLDDLDKTIGSSPVTLDLAASLIQNLQSSAAEETGNAFKKKQMRKKRKSQLRAVANKIQVSSLSISEADGSVLSQLNVKQVRGIGCVNMLTFASRAKQFSGDADRGSARRIVVCICQEYDDCKNLSATAISEMGSYAAFLNKTELDNIPAAAMSALCRQLQAIDISVLSNQMEAVVQQAAVTMCKRQVDLSAVGGSASTDVTAFTSINRTVLLNLPFGGLTTADIAKFDADALLELIGKMAEMPFKKNIVQATCVRYFDLTRSAEGNYTIKSIAGCAEFISSANQSRVDPADVALNADSLTTFVEGAKAACERRKSNGLSGDCLEVDETAAYQPAVNFVLQQARNGGAALRRRRKRSSYTLTCTQVQNFGAGLSAVTPSDFDAMSNSEFQSCISAFGAADVAWSSAQCSKIKAKTEALYGATNTWTNTLLLSVGCLTQCWSSAEIAAISYSEIGHISDIGQQCSRMSAAAKQSIVSAYITRAKSNSPDTMTRTEISSLGHLTCGATSAHIGNFNHTHVLNSLTELGTAGPCDTTVMQAYIDRLRSALGSLVSSWSDSYFSSVTNLLGGLTNAELATLTEAQIANIDASAIPHLTSAQMASFSVTQLASFSASQKSSVTSAQLSAMSSEQRAAVGGDPATTAAGCVRSNWLVIGQCLSAAIFVLLQRRLM